MVVLKHQALIDIGYHDCRYSTYPTSRLLCHEPVYRRRGYGYIGLEKLEAYGFSVLVLFLSRGRVVKPHSRATHNGGKASP